MSSDDEIARWHARRAFMQLFMRFFPQFSRAQRLACDSVRGRVATPPATAHRHTRHQPDIMKGLLLFALNPSSTTPALRSNAVHSFRQSSFPSIAMSATSKSLVVDPFCYRQFAEHEEASKSYKGTVFSLSVAEFEDIANARFDEANLKDGYAPFCKHIFIENDIAPEAKVNVLPITNENDHLLRSKYEARNDKELPVLTRWFPSELVGDNLPTAKYLDLILYSREQINKENESMGKAGREGETAPWGIVSIKAQDVDHELPMTPITAMRNALGKEHGGSGVPINREAYMEAYNFWKDHATVS